MKWKEAPIIKIYEALGSVADDRVEVDGNTGKVYSSSGNKYYDVIYDPDKNAITSNDNGSYWVGYLGYPSIAFLMKIGVIPYDTALANLLKGFTWKDINTKFKNDFDKTQAYIDAQIVERSGTNIDKFHKDISELHEQVNTMQLGKIMSSAKPPTAY